MVKNKTIANVPTIDEGV